ncbi:acyl-coenzyme A:6-aminopenicillanic acid acyl-transferase-domain-containing protein [Microdochium trichocladiopsis]|uniref:Acyl-coenzyme A:6-aminopenicillanic acid acyl-transferase-domain-containing protein n=1 Tax=Microdochium trichocladiopsis TaxID=1682393 RepID=A0A9P8Y659_9PEZI|nr:acyl-coenzyme A:6-aminopenicillanic acid acyl-transferase-domain-containing protein [Microdochium trichocladiopsis]KAH7028866.1 acyl-coenzyme A:6-aminopenicillanic acid acyl-transferase-domain-containing protein [Microdochium trichocladiopsis]
MALQVFCSGTPYEIGQHHGRKAHAQVRSSLSFYTGLFAKACSLSWLGVRGEAQSYLEHLERSCPRYVEEMRGVADGVNAASAGDQNGAHDNALDLLDIVALNVRSEIVFGLFTDHSNGVNGKGRVQDPPMDGCTSVGLVAGDDAAPGHTYLAQNWDWFVGQRENLIVLHISSSNSEKSLPDIIMVTEAGIIGKIGFNSAGVGICQNAIRARGVDVASGRLPVHLAMRRVLESWSCSEAVQALTATGVAGSVYLLVGDGHDESRRVSGIECTSTSVKEIGLSPPSPDSAVNMLAHTNHLLLEHAGVDEPSWLADSDPRVQRIQRLVDQMHKQGQKTQAKQYSEKLFELFKDEEGYPMSINRREIGQSTSETLFTIVMDLTAKKALVTFGRPSAFVDRVDLAF